MKNNPLLNGSDQLMRGFDYELRRCGFAGNSCQIVLELASKISAEVLKSRLAALQKRFPILNAHIGGIFRPKWKTQGRGGKQISVRVHADEPNLREKLFNERLATKRGELIRLDLVECASGMDLIFTWAHALMDATAAEHFLAAISDETFRLPDALPPPREIEKLKWPARMEMAKKSVEQLDKFCEAQPRSFLVRHPDAPRELRYHIERFSADETARIRGIGSQFCGVLGDAQFHAAVCAMELHRLHQKLGCTPASYVLPMPVGLRPKGRVEPLFSNQVDMLMLQLLPGHLDSIEKTVAALKTQTTQAVRENSLRNSRLLSEMFGFLPLPIYMAVLKHGLKGEICSLFFGDTAVVNPRLENFLGARVENFAHIAAVTPKPGLGVIFYYFRGELKFTVIHAKTVLSEDEATAFAGDIRARLLNP